MGQASESRVGEKEADDLPVEAAEGCQQAGAARWPQAAGLGRLDAWSGGGRSRQRTGETFFACREARESLIGKVWRAEGSGLGHQEEKPGPDKGAPSSELGPGP